LLERLSATATKEVGDCSRKGSIVKAEFGPEDEDFHSHVPQKGAQTNITVYVVSKQKKKRKKSMEDSNPYKNIIK
jgi:hypothetical protein